MIENIEKLCKEAFNVHNVEQLFYFAEKYDFRPLKSDNYKKELLIDVMEEEYFYKSPIVTLKFKHNNIKILIDVTFRGYKYQHHSYENDVQKVLDNIMSSELNKIDVRIDTIELIKFDKIENYLYSTCCLDNIIDKIVKKYNNTTIDMISKEDIVVDYNFKGSNSKELCTFNFYE